jgi:cation diffusion facilitator family transporter
MVEEKCIRCGRKVAWITLLGNLSQSVFKVAVGLLGQSSALFADGIHSIADMVGNGAVIASRRVSDRPADKSHPFGHGKAELLSSSYVYLIIAGMAVLIFGGGLLMIVHSYFFKPSFIVIVLSVLSIFYNLLMSGIGKCAAIKNSSPALLANAFENRVDAMTSIAVIVGVAGAIWIHPACDAVATMVVAAIIFVNCIGRLRESVNGLMDQSLPMATVRRIKQIALAQEGVVDVDYVRTRKSGNDVFWVDLQVRVPPHLSVEQSDQIAAEVRCELMLADVSNRGGLCGARSANGNKASLLVG